MPIPNQAEVCAILKPYQEIFRDIALDAWTRWQRNPEKSELYRRSRAALIHNYMMLDALDRLANVDGVFPIERHESAVFLIKDSVVVRFKKGNEQGLSRNYPTQSALAFNDPQEALFDLPHVVRVDVVYILNKYETAVEDVLIVARDGETIIWSESIFADATGGAEVIPFTPFPSEPPAPDSTMRVPGHEKENGAAKEK